MEKSEKLIKFREILWRLVCFFILVLCVEWAMVFARDLHSIAYEIGAGQLVRALLDILFLLISISLFIFFAW